MALRILITGGFGFVGGRLAVHLNQAGHQIILGSRSLKKIPSWLQKAEVTEVLWHSDNSLESICKNIDIIIQAAGMNANDSAKDPIGALHSNGVATLRLLTAACRAGVKRFVYLSTAHIYADPLVGVISENTCPKNLHPYATSHFAGEQISPLWQNEIGWGAGGRSPIPASAYQQYPIIKYCENKASVPKRKNKSLVKFVRKIYEL